MTDTKRFYGRVQWRELMTTDVERAKSFYGALLPWTFKSEEMGGGFVYTLIHVGDKQIAGMYARMPGMEGVPPHWASYVSVPDVDAACKAAKDHGGHIPREPMDLPDVGRMAPIVDPDGAVIWAYRSSTHGDTPPGRPATGEFCWETLTTRDVARAKTFYGAVFGWKAKDAPMPVFSVDDTPEGMVADFQKVEGTPPAWITYVVVDNLAASRDRAAQLGGKVLVPNVDVPDVGSFALVADPTGAALGLFTASSPTR